MESTRKVEQEAANGGVPCVGSPKRTMACNKESCPGRINSCFDLALIYDIYIYIINTEFVIII